MSNGYVVTNNVLMINYGGKSYVVNKNNVKFEDIKKLLQRGRYKSAVEMSVFSTEMVDEYTHGNIIVRDGTVYFKNKKVTSKVVNHIKQFKKKGIDYTHLVKFLDKLMLNPSEHVVSELYDFIKSGTISITPDGNILAYKRVEYNNNGDLVDKYTQSIIHNVGSYIEMDRKLCNMNRDVHCSTGFHFCSLEYLPNYGSSQNDSDTIVIMEINPKDVTSIPSDYNYTKGRCCAYYVAEIHPYDDRTNIFTKPVMTVGEITNKRKSIPVDGKHYLSGRKHKLFGWLRLS